MVFETSHALAMPQDSCWQFKFLATLHVGPEMLNLKDCNGVDQLLLQLVLRIFLSLNLDMQMHCCLLSCNLDICHTYTGS